VVFSINRARKAKLQKFFSKKVCEKVLTAHPGHAKLALQSIVDCRAGNAASVNTESAT
jgi:hypothetical protein